MKAFFKGVLINILGTIVSSIIFILILIGIINLIIPDNDVVVKENSVLKINLSNINVVERSSNNPFDELNLTGVESESIELKEILDNIEKAKKDNNIKAIYINTSFVNAGLSQIEEIRNKLLEFKAYKKPIIAYSEVYSQTAYYLASVADEIYLNPAGVIELKGLSISQMFYTGLLEKLDIDMQIIRHGKFKSAVEPFTLSKMSNENREQMSLLVNSLSKNIISSIAKERKLPINLINEHTNNLSLENAKSCLELGYVDGLLYQDQVEKKLISISKGEKLNVISLEKYNEVKDKSKKVSSNKIAIIYATGTIDLGNGDETSIGSITTAKAIKKAREDKNVKAIILRINSGGGSALASDIIWRETQLIKKPFVVSMGDYAASGGYYIACEADHILANRTTLTGSIGVFGMIPNLQNFYKNKLGITIDTVNTHKSADMGIDRALTTFERKKIQQGVEETYNTFISKVAKGRNMTTNEVDQIGQGRVWSGFDAKSIGLIDSYGGLEEAINIACNLAKIKDHQIISLPKKKDLLQDLMLKIGEDATISNLLIQKLGVNSKLIDPIEDLLQQDKIQARMPYIIELK
jgi:protease-4